MKRILDLLAFYAERDENGIFEPLVYNFRQTLRAFDNKDAQEKAETALKELLGSAKRKDHIYKLKSFLYDLITKEVKVQPLL